MQQHCIGINGSFFNTQRMLGQYFTNAYYPRAGSSEDTVPRAAAQPAAANIYSREPALA
jgi:starch phosphorylase